MLIAVVYISWESSGLCRGIGISPPPAEEAVPLKTACLLSGMGWIGTEASGRIFSTEFNITASTFTIVSEY